MAQSTRLEEGARYSAAGSDLWLAKSKPPASQPSPDTTKVRSSMRPSAPKRLARRRPQARSSPVAFWAGAGHHVGQAGEGLEPVGAEQAGAHQDVLVGEGQQGPAVLVAHHGPEDGVGPGGAVDGGQPDQERRRAADALQRGERVPAQLGPSRARVTSTHSSRCFDKNPISNRGSRSAHRSAISASSASLIDVQSLVSTWMDMCRSVLLDLPASPSPAPGLTVVPGTCRRRGGASFRIAHARRRPPILREFQAACRIRPPRHRSSAPDQGIQDRLRARPLPGPSV